MWKDLDLEEMAEAEHRASPPRSPEAIAQIVIMARWELYNRDRPCGAGALRQRLEAFYHLKPLPSVRTIGRILARNDLIERR